jgi:hypothetical protein
VKRCTKCGELKPLDEFYRSNGGRDGRRADCKACDATRRRVWYRANRERVIANVVAWQRDNKERYNARQREYRESHPDRDWPAYLRRNFGLTVDEYEAFVAAHDSRCAICDAEPPEGKRHHLDHDHESGAVRGLLCVRCNNGLGQFRESPALLQRAADYLECGGFVPGHVLELAETARARALALKAAKAC